jgi:hypothetical protein
MKHPDMQAAEKRLGDFVARFVLIPTLLLFQQDKNIYPILLPNPGDFHNHNDSPVFFEVLGHCPDK